MGWCGWTGCAQNRVLSHRAQDMACFWFEVDNSHWAQILRLLGAIWGRFSDTMWRRALEGSSKHVEYSHLFPFVASGGHFEHVLQWFWAKKGAGVTYSKKAKDRGAPTRLNKVHKVEKNDVFFQK